MKILYDHDIEPLLSYRTCINILEKVLLAKSNQQIVCPPRDYFLTEKGALVFTKGELIQEKAVGFRLYAIPKSSKNKQITVVMDTHTGDFKGIIIGKLIGVYRTACLNALAIKYLSRQNATSLGVIGLGFQARHQVLAALEVRAISTIMIYGRNPEKRGSFIQFIQSKSNRKDLTITTATSPNEVAENSDILICATSSPTPILSNSAIKKGLHINNIGPKYKDRHELPLTTYQKADKIITDNILQLYDTTFLGEVCFKELTLKSEILSLENCMTGFERRVNDITLFCSMGLSGTEVALADWVFKNLHKLAEHPKKLEKGVFKRLLDIAEISKIDEKELAVYQENLKDYWDLNSSMDTYFNEGIEKGRKEEKIEIAKNLIQLGSENSLLQQATGLSIAEIEALKKEIK